MNKQNFRKWIIEQKYTLQRGYSWANIPAMGIVVAGSIKGVLPGLFDKFWKFAILVVIGIIGLWLIGWIDKKWHFLHAEQDYATVTNPTLMEIIEANRKKEEANGQVKV
jgi:hypothetical protein